MVVFVWTIHDGGSRNRNRGRWNAPPITFTDERHPHCVARVRVEIDDDLLRYRRLPKHEMGRERPEWSDERAGILQDAVWHTFERWEIRPHPDAYVRRLVIFNVDGTTRCVIAPLPYHDAADPRTQ